MTTARQIEPDANSEAPVTARQPGLDTLRALAVALTFLMHFGWLYAATFLGIDLENQTTTQGRTLEERLLTAQYYSLYGVYLFFMISGFLIARKWLGDVPPTLKTYVSDRARRIFPAFWIALAAAGILAAMRTPPTTITLPLTLANASLINWFDPHNMPPWLIVSWSLQVEWIFYLCMPALAALLKVVRIEHRTAVLWAVAILTAVALKSIGERHFAYPLFFAVGIQAALSVETAQKLAAKLHTYATIATVIALQIAYSALSPIGAQKSPWHFGSFDMFAGAFVLLGGALFVKIAFRPTKRLVSPSILLLGRISYSFYLWHLLVLICVFDALHKLQLVPVLTAWPWPARWCMLILVTVALSIAVSLVSYNAMERPYFAKSKRQLPNV